MLLDIMRPCEVGIVCVLVLDGWLFGQRDAARFERVKKRFFL